MKRQKRTPAYQTNLIVDEPNLLEKKNRTRFLKSKEWKAFRQEVITLNKSKCECCGVKTSKPNIHHMDMNKEHYSDLRIENFKLLCKNCHDYVHYLERRKELPPNLKELKDRFFL